MPGRRSRSSSPADHRGTSSRSAPRVAALAAARLASVYQYYAGSNPITSSDPTGLKVCDGLTGPNACAPGESPIPQAQTIYGTSPGCDESCAQQNAEQGAYQSWLVQRQNLENQLTGLEAKLHKLEQQLATEVRSRCQSIAYASGAGMGIGVNNCINNHNAEKLARQFLNGTALAVPAPVDFIGTLGSEDGMAGTQELDDELIALGQEDPATITEGIQAITRADTKIADFAETPEIGKEISGETMSPGDGLCRGIRANNEQPLPLADSTAPITDRDDRICSRS